METFMQTLADSIREAIGPFMAAIPKIVAFLAIWVIGWIVAALIARGVASLLRAVRFNDLSQRSGFSDMVTKMGTNTDGAGFVGLVTKWFLRLITIVIAFDALGLPAVSGILHEFLLWIPNLVVALIVLVIGGLAANALAGIVRGGTEKAGLGNPTLLSNSAWLVVWVFAVAIALNQIGIATSLVNALFIAVVGMIALALGLAFGLGARDTAGEIVRRWYQKSQETAPRLRKTAKGIEEETRRH